MDDEVAVNEVGTYAGDLHGEVDKSITGAYYAVENYRGERHDERADYDNAQAGHGEEDKRLIGRVDGEEAVCKEHEGYADDEGVDKAHLTDLGDDAHHLALAALAYDIADHSIAGSGKGPGAYAYYAKDIAQHLRCRQRLPAQVFDKEEENEPATYAEHELHNEGRGHLERAL